MNKRLENMRLANIAQLNKLAVFAVKNPSFTAKDVAKLFGCNSINAVKFINRYDAVIEKEREGRKIIYRFKEGVLTNFNVDAIVTKALYVKGYTEKYLAKHPDKQKIEKLEKENQKLQNNLLNKQELDKLKNQNQSLKEEIKYLKAQLENFEHLKVCLKNILENG